MLRPLTLALLTGVLNAAALNFVVQDSVQECGQTTVNFTSGTPPYMITAIAAFSTAMNFTVPDDAMTDNGGSHTFMLPFAEEREVVFVMSDATGFGAGGASPLFRVGARASSSPRCPLASEDPPFTFAVYPEGGKLNQCRDVSFTWEGPAMGDVFIFGVVPGGMMQVAAPASGGKTNFGPAKFPVNTTVLYAAWDAVGQSGGSSRLQTVVPSSSDECMKDDNVLSSTPVWNPSATATGGPTPTATRGGVVTVTSTALPAGSAGLTPGSIAGIVIGVIFGVLLLQALIVYFCCRRQLNNYLASRRARKERHSSGNVVDLYERRQDTDGNYPLRRDDETISPFMGGTGTGRPNSGWESQLSTSNSTVPFDSPRVSYAANGAFSNSNSNSPILPSVGSGVFTTPQYPPVSVNQGQGNQGTQGNQGGQGNQASRLPMKLQLAMANPDNAIVTSEGPPQSAPTGGFRRHEDAGPVEESERIEDLPPTYNPQWDAGR